MNFMKGNRRKKHFVSNLSRMAPSTTKTSFSSMPIRGPGAASLSPILSEKNLPQRKQLPKATDLKRRKRIKHLIFTGYEFSALSVTVPDACKLAVEMLLQGLSNFPFHNFNGQNKFRELAPKKTVKKFLTLTATESHESLYKTKRGRKNRTLDKEVNKIKFPLYVEEDELKKDIKDFVKAVSEKYHRTSFHSFLHALDVMQLLFTMLTTHVQQKVNPISSFAALIAALCHDIGHPGASTPFLKSIGLLKGFNSLEEYHINLTLDLFSKTELFKEDKYFTSEQLKRFTDLIKLLIDSTDISKSEQFCNVAKAHAEQRKAEKGKFLREGELCALMKIADLANLVRNFSDAQTWSAILGVETKAMTVLQNNLESVAGSEIDIESMDDLVQQLLHLQEDIQETEMEQVYKSLPKNTMFFIKNFVQNMVATVEYVSPQIFGDYSRRIRGNQGEWLEAANNK
eukprot:snap_masked-scaffold_29-processed-gene-2.58-mRNA-1 protein AED:1.00 eAED:1.00 QI:0/-1/0/0/-1/1/1/0/455